VHARVILPANYDDLPGRRFPVIYFLHGLPARASSYRGNAWLVDAMAQVGPAILVLPQGARDADTDPEYLNWGSGRNWENYIARELPHYIDAHFRTIRSRAGRAIVGLSAVGTARRSSACITRARSRSSSRGPATPPDRPDGDAATRTRRGGERAHPRRGAPPRFDLLRVLRRAR